MADNAEETTTGNEAEAPAAESGDAEPAMNSDQNFAYWLTMLPFLIIAAVFVFEFSKTPGEYNKLINAVGAVVVGIFAASFVNALTGGDKKDEAAAENQGAESPSS